MAAMNNAKLEELKEEALSRFDRIGEFFEAMRQALENEGYKSGPYLAAQESVQKQLMRLRSSTAVLAKPATLPNSSRNPTSTVVSSAVPRSMRQTSRALSMLGKPNRSLKTPF